MRLAGQCSKPQSPTLGSNRLTGYTDYTGHLHCRTFRMVENLAGLTLSPASPSAKLSLTRHTQHRPANIMS